MARLLIRNVDDALHARLKEAAARHRRSLEEEVRELLRTGVAAAEARPPGETLWDVAKRLFQPLGGIELQVPERSLADHRSGPDFSGPGWDRPEPKPGR